MKHKHELFALGVFAAAIGTLSASSYVVIASSFAAQGDVLEGTPLHAAASSSSPEQFVTALTLILLGFALGAYVALRRKKGLGLFPWK